MWAWGSESLGSSQVLPPAGARPHVQSPRESLLCLRRSVCYCSWDAWAPFLPFRHTGRAARLQLFLVLPPITLQSPPHCPRCEHRAARAHTHTHTHTHRKLSNDCWMNKWTNVLRISRVLLTYTKVSGVPWGISEPQEPWVLSTMVNAVRLHCVVMVLTFSFTD